MSELADKPPYRMVMQPDYAKGDDMSLFGPDDSDLLGPPYTPVERVDVLVRCNRCGAVVDGNVLGQNQHDIWHSSLDRRIEQAGRWKPAPRYK